MDIYVHAHTNTHMLEAIYRCQRSTDRLTTILRCHLVLAVILMDYNT